MKKLSVLLILMLIVTFFVARYIRSETLNPTPPPSAPFDSTKWFSQTKNDRTLMAQNLIQSKRLIGLKAASVIKIIGKPSYTVDSIWGYHIGTTNKASTFLLYFSNDTITSCLQHEMSN